ncbi:MAG: pyridoxal phosphate-dependent aminotransferase [Methanobacteriota archaeon]
MEFPPFEHLHLYEDLRGAFLNVSYSNVTPYTLREFRRTLPGDLGLDWTDPEGVPELRRTIARRHGVSEDRVLVTSGATEAYFLVNAALLRGGDRVVVDAPIYSPLRDSPRGFGAEVVCVPRDCRDGWTLEPDAWDDASRPRARAFVLANLNNPTSSVLERPELRELADLASERGAYVVVDETFREMARDPPPSVTTFGPHGIALSTVTKLYGLGALRVGWVVAHPDVLRRLRSIKDYTTVGGSSLAQILASWAIRRHGAFARRARGIVDRNRRLVAERLDRMPALHGEVPASGTVFFPHSDVPVERLATRLLRTYRTVIAPGRLFGTDDHFRIGLGGDTEELRRGLDNLRRALADLKGARAPPRTRRRSPRRARPR